MQLLAIAIPFLIAVALAPHVSLYYDVTPKVVLIFVGAAAALVLAFFRLDSLSSLPGTKRGRWFLIAAGASILISIASAPLAAHPALAWNGSNWRRYGSLTECATIVAAVLIGAYAAGNMDRLRSLQRAICAAGLLTSLYGMAQYFGWDPLLPHSGYEAGEGVFRIVRPPSTLGHADYFAAFLLWPVFMGLSAVRQEPGRGGKLLAAASSATGMAAILLSGTRGALLALMLGLCIFAALLRPNLRAIAAGAGIAGVALALFYISPAGERLRARVHWIGEDRTGGARLLLWRDSLRMAGTHPLTGFGPDNFVAEFPRFESVDLAQTYPDFFQESPHNMLLDALTAEGLPGLLALLAAIAAATWTPRASASMRVLLPLFALPFLYAELPALIAAAGHQGTFDATVIQWESRLFGGQPASAWAHHMPVLAISEILHGAYLLYYAIIFSVPVVLYSAGRSDDLSRAAFVLLLTFVACFAIYVAFPVAGPRYVWPAPTGVPQGPVRSAVLWLLETGSSRGTAFPSSHVAVSVTQSILAVRYLGRRGWIVPTITTGLAAGAVYGGFHYAIDVVAGAILGALIPLLAIRRWRVRPRSPDR